ncbi:MAG: alpha/beta hydrolase [Polaromonas sp.]|nr:alpha/beta hydrolase [Polaromonas sp.]
MTLSHRTAIRLLLSTLGALLLGACSFLRPATVPMATVWDKAGCSAKPAALLVFLPGAYSTTDEFVREGFVREVRARRIDADIVMVDAHTGYYQRRTVIDRLEADVLAPARAQGYRSLWLVGISIGGFGALIHEEQRPGNVTGIVTLAPYLGERPMAGEIQAAGGLRTWKAPARPLEAEQTDLRLWRWLQSHVGQTTPPIYLGYGTEDRFADRHRLLAAALPPQQVFTTPGGHDWPEWRRLWQQMLPVLPLPACR